MMKDSTFCYIISVMSIILYAIWGDEVTGITAIISVFTGFLSMKIEEVKEKLEEIGNEQ